MTYDPTITADLLAEARASYSKRLEHTFETALIDRLAAQLQAAAERIDDLESETGQLVSGEAWGRMIAQHKALTNECQALRTTFEVISHAVELANITSEATDLVLGRKKPSARDGGRLQQGAAALAASEPAAIAHLKIRYHALPLLRQLHDAIAAMQSLDDLGEEGNRDAQRDLEELQRRYEKLKGLP
jgi:hypothetical protein